MQHMEAMGAEGEPRAVLKEDPAKSYGSERNNILIEGDNLPAMQALLESGWQGRVDCIQLDPPYNTGEVFLSYDDATEASVWARDLRERLAVMHQLLAPGGFLLCHVDATRVGELRLMLDDTFGGSGHRAALFYMLTRHSDPSSEPDKDWVSDPVEMLFVYSKTPGKRPYLQEGETLSTFLDGADFGDRREEGGIPIFRGGKKQEAYIQFGFQYFAPQGGIVLDPYLGSGTGAAVATKMGLQWIGICRDHMDTHCLPRLQDVVDGIDRTGISQAVGWAGGSGFTYYKVDNSSKTKDTV